MKIINLKVENLAHNCVTDNASPRFSFAVSSERRGAALATAEISVNGWNIKTAEQILVPYGGKPLQPFKKYTVNVAATDNYGESDNASVEFETGRMQTPWQAEWITDGSYKFTEKKVSPTPLLFRKTVNTEKPIARAVIYCTALGIYELNINGKKVGNEYFAPGFTSYKTTLQYQTYDVTENLTGNDELTATVAGGWAVGSFVFTRKNRVTANRQAFLLELRITYADGSLEVIGSDESWEVTRGGNYRAADFYDGEEYDAAIDPNKAVWRKAAVERVKISPRIVAEFGAPVTAHEVFAPVAVTRCGNEIIYDFGQNFAGVISAEITGKRGQKITFRHAEVLNADGSPAMQILRTAKATATYVCRDGEQVYSPKLTYMGFRYVGVSGIEESDIKLSAISLYSDIAVTGAFECSDERINKLQANIMWSAKSNFMDIPTDCPQRDERMGWTGDIAVFAPVACYNFDMSRFLEKWLNDVKSEQLKSGGLPNTVPAQGYGFPATMPAMAVDFWGDACLLVPWAEYLARGDKQLLVKMYPVMKKYVNACAFWARLLSLGKRRYIWHTPSMVHFGDWIAPDVDKMSDWQKRSKWTATASLCRTSGLLSKIAGILGFDKDERKYKKLSQKTADAYVSVFTDGNGKLKKEFQTAYVLPLAFGMFPEDKRKRAADNLSALVEKSDYCIRTGFPGTPYILFALADNGREDTAFKMLLNEKCPSWLYEVKAGGTTVWELWDALKADGSLNGGMEDGRGGMISFNHYASGAVGAFLYKRIAGIEPTECGYRSFSVKPLAGGGITFADTRVDTPYGEIESKWKIENGSFMLDVKVPAGAECEVVLPDGKKEHLVSGKYAFTCKAPTCGI